MLVRDCDSQTSCDVDSRRAPTRNRYFYGKMLDAFHLDLEQSYHVGKRWLINQLTLGAGTLCGLEVISTANRRGLQVRAGVAVDGCGREILVPRLSASVDPTRPTDECGQPLGQPLVRGGVVTLYLCYHECPIEPAPVLVDECGPKETCEYGVVEERYRLQIRAGLPDTPPGELPPDVCRRLFAYSPRESLRRLDVARTALAAGNTAAFLTNINELRERRGGDAVANITAPERVAVLGEERDFWVTARKRRGLLCHLWGLHCPTPDDPCVPLAVVAIDANGQVARIDNCGPRNTIFSNSQLLDLILCLADRVDECCAEPAVMSLEKESGDNQVGVASQPLAAPLVVRVTRGGNPVANEDVWFEALGDSLVGANAGALGTTFAIQTDANGRATLPTWRLGANQGGHAVLARIASGNPDQVIFKATARVQATLPVVRALWPPPATVLSASENSPWFYRFLRERRLDVTFDRQMNTAHLDTPDSWLGVFVAIPTFAADGVSVMRLPLTRVMPSPGGVLPVTGVVETYSISDADPAGVSVHVALAATIRNVAGGAAVGGAAAAAGAAAGGAPAAAAVAAAGAAAGAGGVRPAVQPAVAAEGWVTAVGPTGNVAMLRPEGFLRVTTDATTRVRSARVITLMRANGANILDAQAPNQLLDADFSGGLLDAAVLKILWTMPPGGTHVFTVAEVWDALADTGRTLPESGDGTEGGEFQAWFEIEVGRGG